MDEASWLASNADAAVATVALAAPAVKHFSNCTVPILLFGHWMHTFAGESTGTQLAQTRV